MTPLGWLGRKTSTQTKNIPFLCLNLILCPFCNSSTFWIIFILLGRNVKQDETTCCLQEWQLWLSYFWIYLLFLCLNLISCPLCNSNTLHNILMILGRNVEQDKTCCLQEWQLCQSCERGDICFFSKKNISSFYCFTFLLVDQPIFVDFSCSASTWIHRY